LRGSHHCGIHVVGAVVRCVSECTHV
jgi:hypothetical protein